MSLFVTTNVGTAAATTAEASGPKISITTFKLTSSVFTPSAALTALPGSVVYTGTCTAFTIYNSETVQVVCEVPASVGPFNYGGIGLYLADGTLYATLSYNSVKTKSIAASDGYSEVLRWRCLMRLTQSPTATFNFYTNNPDSIGEVPNFTYLAAPSSNGTTPAFIVHDPTPDSESMFVYKNTATQWTVAGYRSVGIATVTAADANTVTAALLTTIGDTSSAGKYVIQTTTGQLRKVTSVASGVATVNFALAPVPAVGSQFQVLKHQSDASSMLELVDASSVVGPDSMSPVTNEVLVHEATSTGEPLHLVRTSPTRWSLHNYYYVTTLTPSAIGSSGGKTTFTAAALATLPRVAVGNQYVIQDADTGRVCGIESISGSTATATRTLGWLTLTSNLRVLRPVAERFGDDYTVASLTDVDVASLATGDVLTWDGTKWAAGNGGVPVGTVMTGLWATAPEGYLGLRGEVFTRAAYPRLYAHVLSLLSVNPSIITADSNWIFFNRGVFTYGDGSTTFRMPDYGGFGPRFWDPNNNVDTSGRLMGSFQLDQMPSHTHAGVLRKAQGAYLHYINNYREVGANIDNATGDNTSELTDAAGSGSEVRVKNIALYAVIKY